ncbi:MAG TPA: hypothetical protein VFE31_01105 [Opitutaceae bacterium]|jgi:hypothetical protein|nr:hypothetical protein [Opitutaceae bacterium]
MSGNADFGWFGEGWLAGRSAAAGAEILAIVWLVGLVAIWLSYRFGVSRLSRPRRTILAGLRAILLTGVLLLLAAPARIERSFSHPPQPRPLAVLVDRSASMTTADNRGQRRIDDAFAQWNDWMRANARKFGPASDFAFAGAVAPVATVADVPLLPTLHTRLFDSLQWVLAHGPPQGWGGVVALTDGLDTETPDMAEAARETTQKAVNAGTPLFFAVGHNRALGRPFLHLREFNAPAAVSPHSVVHLSAVFESYQRDDTAVPLHVAINGVPQPPTVLHLEAGRHLATWALDYPAVHPGRLRFDLRAGSEAGRAQVAVNAAEPHRVLYLAGEFNWGYTRLAESLRRGGEYSMTPVFRFPLRGVALPPGAVAPFCLTENSLSPFGVVILENAAADRLNSAEQAALDEWTERGGVLLFWISQPSALAKLAGTDLEKLLPVTLLKGGEAPAADFIPGLLPMQWASPAVAADLFGKDSDALADATPRIAHNLTTGPAKPAAVVLARTPGRGGKSGAILLAAQPYGEGRTALLTSDGLWRWALAQPSGSHGAEVFWQKLFSWLTREQAAKEYFDHPPAEAAVGQRILLRVRGAKGGALHVVARLGSRHIELPEQPLQAGDTANGARLYAWEPPDPGLWRIEAGSGQGSPIPIWIDAEAVTPDRGELSGAAPDEDLLQQLAAGTGGDVIGQGEPAWAEPPAPHLLSVERMPLWHRWWVLALLVAVYGFDLALRRRWKLL